MRDDEIKYTIEPEDVEWEYVQSKKPDGSLFFPDKPEKEMIFEKEDGLALLLINEVIFLNDYWAKKEWPEEDRQAVRLLVICNDVFAWGCSDCEQISLKELESLYRMWKKDPGWGSAVWCMIKRRELPQRPVTKRIREAGIWDLDALQKEHGLRSNHYDSVSRVLALRKYDAYCAWEKAHGKEPRLFDAQWWDGWNEYTAANPNWNDEAWKAADTAAAEEWRKNNGF